MKLIKNEHYELKMEIDNQFNFFKTRIKQGDMTPYDKYLLILYYNYQDIGLKDSAKEVMHYFNPKYFETILDDMRSAVDSRNKADRLMKVSKHDDAQQYVIEAEFFLVCTGVLKYLEEDDMIKDSEYYKDFKSKLKDEKFVIELTPELEVVK
jgi:hypothetical protein